MLFLCFAEKNYVIQVSHCKIVICQDLIYQPLKICGSFGQSERYSVELKFVAVTLIYGATLLVALSTTKALMQHPSSTLAPKPAVLARHEHSTETKSKLVQLASAMVASDIPKDLPPLEETPPPPFPEHAKSCRKDQ